MEDLRVATPDSEPSADHNPSRTITVLGPGAVGGLLAAMLSRSGEPTDVVARQTTHDRLLGSGLTVKSGTLGTWTASPHLVAIPERGATVLLTVKAPGIHDAIELLKNANPAQVVPLLNGVQHIATLREALPRTQVVPATITVEAQRIETTTIEHRSPFVRITVPTTLSSNHVFQSLARAGVEIVAGGEGLEVLWRKFRFLATMAMLTAFHQQPLGDALEADPSLTARVIAEVADVCTAAGLPTSHTELESILAGLPRGMRSSLQLDLAAGGANELDAIGGALLRAAREHSVAVPASSRIVGDLELRYVRNRAGV
jgi:2-dehydropantoate 2-reductase